MVQSQLSKLAIELTVDGNFGEWCNDKFGKLVEEKPTDVGYFGRGMRPLFYAQMNPPALVPTYKSKIKI